MTFSDEVREFLQEPQFAVVATIAPDGIPHQTVMWYVLDGDGLLLNTPNGSLKHRQLKQDSRISVCIERGYAYVTLIGRVELVEDSALAGADYARIGQHYATINVPRPARPPKGGFVPRERVSLRMTVEKVISQGVE